MTKTRFFAPLAAAALLAAGAAPAFAKTQDGQTVEAASAGKSERKICKRFDRSESRMRSERVCLTKAGWEKLQAEQ